MGTIEAYLFSVLSDFLLQRLHCIAEAVYPESQSGYREGRSSMGGIFTLRQIMEKCREQRRNLYIVFIDFTKAFDSVNRDMLFKILRKLGCPPKFIRIIKKLHSDTFAKVIIDGKLSDPIAYNSGVNSLRPSLESTLQYYCT